MTLREHALAYAQRGMAVFPLHHPVEQDDGTLACSCHEGAKCGSPGKHPRTPSGVGDATSDPSAVNAYWSRWPDANIGVACGRGLVVLDIDGPDAHERLRELEVQHGALPPTVTVATGREGGEHRYYAAPEGTRTVDLAPGEPFDLKVRGAGAYVVGPRSRHASGPYYTVTAGEGKRPAQAPDWITTAQLRRNGHAAVTTRLAGEAIPQGRRDSTLLSLAGSMRRDGITASEIHAALTVVNRERCQPPVDEAKVRELADRAGSYATPETAQAARSAGDTPGDTFPLLTYDDLQGLPDPTWLVDGLVPEGLAVIFGAPSAFKSLIALDWALSVATGLPWHGHDVRAGHVVYVAAEGLKGLKARARAWREGHGHPDMSRVHFLAEAVNLLDHAQVERARRTLAELPEPATLLVIDTMARAIPGGDENSARDVGQFIAAVDGQDVGTRLVVHHTTKAADGRTPTERGSGALRGAADMMARVEREGQAPRVELICDKAPKDGEAWPSMTLQRRAVGESLVLDPVSIFDAAADVEEKRRDAVLAYVAENGPVSRNRVVKGVSGKATLVRQTLDSLVLEGRLEESQEGQAKRYSLPRPRLGDEVGRGTPPGTADQPSSRGEAHPRRGCPPGTRLGEPSPSFSSRDGDDPPLLVDVLGSEDAIVDALCDAFNAEEVG